MLGRLSGTQGDGGAAGAGPGPELGPFGPPTLLAELSDPDAEDEDPSLTADSLELYFRSNRAGSDDIWVSRRAATTDAWGPPDPVNELNSPESEQTPSVSLDGLTLWFSSTRPSAHSGMDIWVSERGSRDDSWAEPTQVLELNTDDAEIGPATDEGDLIMMFGTNRDPAGSWDTYTASRPDRSSVWGSATLATGFNTSWSDWDVFVNGGGRQVFFISDRAGDDDIYRATRATLARPFANVEPLTELNTSFQETDPTLSADGRLILFASNRSGNPEIYWASR